MLVLFYVLLIIFVARNSVNAPYFDEWYPSLEVAVASHNGTLSIDQLFRQHVEHRIVPTLVLTAINARLTDWDLRVEMFAGIALAGGSFLMLASLLP